MRFFKRLAVLVVGIAFILSSIAFANDFWTEEERLEYAKNLNLLQSLGVIDGDKDITDTLTRGEFAKIIVSMLMDEPVKREKEFAYSFSDVTEENVYADYIEMALNLGIFNGSGDGEFNPTDMIHTEDAITAVLRAMGYADTAAKAGGYPTGYLFEASRLGLLGGMDVQLGYDITSGELAKLLMNSLGTEFMPRYGSNYQLLGEEGNGLVKHLGIEKRIGIVKATERGNIVNSNRTGKGVININDEIFTVHTDCNSLLGYAVEFYVKTDDEGKIISIGKDLDENEELVIKSEDIVSYNDRSYVYEDGRRTRNVDFSYNIYIVYNGSALANATEELMHPKNGSVKLLDNNGDGEYDIVFITDYAICVVNAVNADEHAIYDMFDSSRSLKFNDEEEYIIKNTSGDVLDISDLKKYNVLSVMQSFDKEFAEITVSTESIRGTVEAIDEENNVTVSKTQYKIVGRDFYGQLNAGASGLFLIDFDGRIAAFIDNTSSGMSIGYVFWGNYAEDDDVPTLYLKILTDAGEVIRLKTAEKVTVDNIRYENDDALTILKKGTEKLLPQVILYALNNDGDIIKLDTPYNNKPEDTDNIYSVLPGAGESKESLRILMPKETRYYRSAQLTFDGKVNISSATVIFTIPEDIENASEEEFDAVTSSYLNGDQQYVAEMYSIGTNKLVADVMVTTATAATAVYNYGIITDSRVVVNEDNEVVTEVSITEYNKEYTAYMEYGETVSGAVTDGNVPKGSFIKFSKNSDDKLKNIEVIYNADTGEMTANPSSASYTAGQRFIFANVYDKENGVIAITTKAPKEGITTEDLENHAADKFKCYMYDTEEKTGNFRKLDVDEIADYLHAGEHCSKVFIYTYFAEPRLLIQYK